MSGSRRNLIVGDLLTLGLVTAIGFITHRETGQSVALRFAAVYVPLVVFWLILAGWFGLLRPEVTSAPKQLWRILPVLLCAAPLAALLRAWFLQTSVVPMFVIVLGGMSALGMLVWRGAYFFLTRGT